MPGEPRTAQPAQPAEPRQRPAKRLNPKVAAALQRYRIAAFVVGVGLIILCVTIVLKYAFGMDWTVEIWGPIHGFLFAAYVLIVFDLAFRARWSFLGMIAVLLAGVIPVVSFVCEAWVTRKMRAGERI